ncbi:MAG: hypothetical protein A2W23_01940 [Planctomycetes bacterium RBG_16_43_13]|nr:MAG: hypothetical protein A2W23_01940 [Planctomycetes bacterium RBG_16_43_13]
MPDPSEVLVDIIRRSAVSGVAPDLDRVIEVGCGGGAVLDMLADRRPRLLVGVDIKPEMPALARLTFVVGNIGWLPIKSKTFDAVVCVNVYNSITALEAENGVFELIRIARRRGAVVIGIQNVFNPLLWLRVSWRKFRQGRRANPVVFSLKQIAGLVKRAGGRIAKVEKISPPPLYYPRNMLWRAVRRCIANIYYYALSRHFRFVAVYNVFVEKCKL